MQPLYYTEMKYKYACTFSMVKGLQQQLQSTNCSSGLFLLSSLRKWSCCWAFLSAPVVLAKQDKYSEV